MWAAIHFGLVLSLATGLPLFGTSGGKPRPAPKCAETRLNNGTIINPLSWQLKYVNETKTLRDVAARLATLDAARRRIMDSNSFRSQIPCNFGNVKNAFCDSVKTPAARGAHAALARKVELALDRPVIFYRHEGDCVRGRRRLLDDKECPGSFGGSIGNHVGNYFRARACARMGGMDFVFLRFLHACPYEIYAWLPAVVATSAAAQPEATAFAHGYTAACTSGQPWIHMSPSWIPAARQGGLDIRRMTAAWAEREGFPARTGDAPLDDVAIHLRCGDTLAQAHGQYGLLHFGALAAFVPRTRPSTVGLISEPYKSFCAEGETKARAGLSEKRSEHSARWCSCPCAAVVDAIVDALKVLRPLATVTVHERDLVMASWHRLANAPTASICISSTFCMWPVLGARHGYFVQGPLFPRADELSDKVSTLGIIKSPGLVSYHTIGMKNLKRCGTSVATMRRAIAQRLMPKGAQLAANATQGVTIRGAKLPPADGYW